jgi:hypothetical protein
MKIILNFAAATAAAAFAFIVTGDASAQGMKVGELKDLSAWVNKMPPGPYSLHAAGKITAPTPCYDALAVYAGDDKSNPPVYRVKITLLQHPGICIQKLTDISFRYSQPNYVGNDASMTIFSDQDSKTIPIDVVQ